MIYALVRPDTLEVRYVGKTRNVASRLKRHRGDSRRSELPVYRWWRKVVERDGCEPCLVRLGEGDSAEEIAMIAKLRADGARLLNLTDGGEGVSGFSRKRSPEEIARAVSTRKSRGAYVSGAHARAISRGMRKALSNPETRAKVVAAQNVGKDAAWREKLSAANKRLWADPEHRERMSAAHRAQVPWNAGTGKPYTKLKRGSLEHRAKLREAQRARRERERKEST